MPLFPPTTLLLNGIRTSFQTFGIKGMKYRSLLKSINSRRSGVSCAHFQSSVVGKIILASSCRSSQMPQGTVSLSSLLILLLRKSNGYELCFRRITAVPRCIICFSSAVSIFLTPTSPSKKTVLEGIRFLSQHFAPHTNWRTLAQPPALTFFNSYALQKGPFPLNSGCAGYLISSTGSSAFQSMTMLTRLWSLSDFLTQHSNQLLTDQLVLSCRKEKKLRLRLLIRFPGSSLTFTSKHLSVVGLTTLLGRLLC